MNPSPATGCCLEKSCQHHVTSLIMAVCQPSIMDVASSPTCPPPFSIALLLPHPPGISGGQLQKMQGNLSKWAGMASSLCAAAGWWQLEAAMGTLAQQAAAGVRPELLPLMQVRCRTGGIALCAGTACQNTSIPSWVELHRHVLIVDPPTAFDTQVV